MKVHFYSFILLLFPINPTRYIRYVPADAWRLTITFKGLQLRVLVRIIVISELEPTLHPPHFTRRLRYASHTPDPCVPVLRLSQQHCTMRHVWHLLAQIRTNPASPSILTTTVSESSWTFLACLDASPQAQLTLRTPKFPPAGKQPPLSSLPNLRNRFRVKYLKNNGPFY